MSIPETCCLHCNAILTPKDIADGWCDSCGKRIPLSIKGSVKSKPAVVVPVDVDTPDVHRTPPWAWALTVAVLIGVAAVFFFGRGG